MIKHLLAIVFVFAGFIASAQNGTISGTLMDENGKAAIPNAAISLKGTEFKAVSGNDGSFKIENVPMGTYTIEASSENGGLLTREIKLESASLELGPISTATGKGQNQITEGLPIITLNDAETKDNGSQNVAGILSASRDVFISASAFTFFPAHFRFRGYGAGNNIIYMNGIPMSNLEDGYTSFSEFTGLNDVMRGREYSIGLDATNYSFATVGGSLNIDSRASNQRKGFNVSYSNSNRSYRHRLMATYNTGLLKHGWAVSISASRRWAQQGYIKGTSMDAYAYFFGVSKQLGKKNELSLTIFGSPSKTGKSSPEVQEVYDVMGTHYYNPNWGYQNGEVRNARIKDTHLPMAILTHELNPNNHSNLTTAISFQMGRTGNSALDWYNAPDPRPDYYRYLPSYTEDSTSKAEVTKAWQTDPNVSQINWNRLYDVNSHSVETVNGVTGKRSRYVVGEDRVDVKKFNFNTVYNNTINEHFTMSAGLTYQYQRTRNYKVVKDLLGGDFFVDVNQFAERTYPDSSAAQNDLARPNRLVRVGDQYSYDYNITNHKASGWYQGDFTFKKVDFFLAAQLSYGMYYRTGNVTNGLFPNSSFGDSEKKHFINYGFKGGLTYKINGRNYLFANAMYETRAPFFDNVFLSPRTRNDYAPNVLNEKVYSFEGGYQFKSPRLKGKAVFFYTQFINGSKNQSFYDDNVQNFVNYTITNMNTRHLGVELAVEGNIYKGFSASGVLSIGRYQYTDRPLATITQDNSNAIIAKDEVIYAKNFWVANGPQLASTIGLNYNSPKFWYVGANFNYFDRIWVDFNPARRTSAGVDLVPYQSTAWTNIVNQEQLKGQFTMDIRGGYSFRINNVVKKKLKHTMTLNLNAGINNVTNNTNFKNFGFEQLRYDYKERNPYKYPAKYTYGLGINYFVSLAFRFN
jgi:Carboxypeptidase regulatory-like domain/TonB dependent receptor